MQKRLVIEWVVDNDTAAAIANILASCPDGPTYQIQRGPLPGESTILFSKRTYQFLQENLRELRQKGNI